MGRREPGFGLEESHPTASARQYEHGQMRPKETEFLQPIEGATAGLEAVRASWFGTEE
jgi:hypothetical protein